MARARNIKPSIMDNEDLAELEPLTRLLFIYLWMLADREGRLEDRPKRIAAQALAYDRNADVQAMLDVLQRGRFIDRYSAGGVACIQITGFSKHQTPHGTEKDSVLPSNEGKVTKHIRGKNGYATGEVELTNCELTVKKQNVNTLIPDSGYLIPDSLIPDSLVVQDKPAKQKARRSQIPDDFYPNEAGVEAAQEAKLPMPIEVASFSNHHKAKGSVMADWQAAWRTWVAMSVKFAKAKPAQAESFRERDDRLGRERWEEMTGRIHPGNTKNVINITPMELLA
jgi:hypothetical protein